MNDTDVRTIYKTRYIYEDETWDRYWQGKSTARPTDHWDGSTPQDVIEKMNHDLGPRHVDQYRIVEGST